MVTVLELNCFEESRVKPQIRRREISQAKFKGFLEGRGCLGLWLKTVLFLVKNFQNFVCELEMTFITLRLF